MPRSEQLTVEYTPEGQIHIAKLILRADPNQDVSPATRNPISSSRQNPNHEYVLTQDALRLISYETSPTL